MEKINKEETTNAMAYCLYLPYHKSQFMDRMDEEYDKLPEYPVEFRRVRKYKSRSEQLDAYANTMCEDSQLFECEDTEEAISAKLAEMDAQWCTKFEKAKETVMKKEEVKDDAFVGYIAQDKYDKQSLYIYREKPQSIDGSWCGVISSDFIGRIPHNLFPELNFDNSPKKVKIQIIE
jgi:hypothetical protein